MQGSQADNVGVVEGESLALIECGVAVCSEEKEEEEEEQEEKGDGRRSITRERTETHHHGTTGHGLSTSRQTTADSITRSNLKLAMLWITDLSGAVGRMRRRSTDIATTRALGVVVCGIVLSSISQTRTASLLLIMPIAIDNVRSTDVPLFAVAKAHCVLPGGCCA